jgi:hypothetical protein
MGPSGKNRIKPMRCLLSIDQPSDPKSPDQRLMMRMNKELFGVFGDYTEFEQLHSD